MFKKLIFLGLKKTQWQFKKNFGIMVIIYRDLRIFSLSNASNRFRSHPVLVLKNNISNNWYYRRISWRKKKNTLYKINQFAQMFRLIFCSAANISAWSDRSEWWSNIIIIYFYFWLCHLDSLTLLQRSFMFLHRFVFQHFYYS